MGCQSRSPAAKVPPKRRSEIVTRNWALSANVPDLVLLKRAILPVLWRHPELV
jgi:hypothetical protein